MYASEFGRLQCDVEEWLKLATQEGRVQQGSRELSESFHVCIRVLYICYNAEEWLRLAKGGKSAAGD